jgi:hypothetical protein
MPYSGILHLVAPEKKTDISQNVSLANVYLVPISLILYCSMMEATRPYETSVLITIAPRHITEDSILHRHRFENDKSYKKKLRGP